jgi:hypothetical protein
MGARNGVLTAERLHVRLLVLLLVLLVAVMRAGAR